MRVGAIVVNFNGADDLARCLASLRGQDHPLDRIVVVDNASTDGSRELLDELATTVGTDVIVVANPTNRGYAGGANDGMVAVGDVDAVLVANPDVEADAGFVAAAVAALEADERRGAVQGRLVRSTSGPAGGAVLDTTGHVAFRSRLFHNRGGGEVDRGQWHAPGEVFGVSGALALYRVAMLDDVAVEVVGRDGTGRREVFDEDLFAYWEDVDLDWRAAMRGWHCWYEPAAMACHRRGGAAAQRGPLVEELNFANRLLVLVKNDTWRGVLPVLPVVLVTTLAKLAVLLVTSPRAAVGAVARLRLIPRMVARRPAIHGRATVPSGQVVARWFGPSDHRARLARWRHRVRGHS